MLTLGAAFSSKANDEVVSQRIYVVHHAFMAASSSAVHSGALSSLNKMIPEEIFDIPFKSKIPVWLPFGGPGPRSN